LEIFALRTISALKKGGTMTVIRWMSLARHAGLGLCATCAWGTTRKGYQAKELEIFCRLISPNGPVPFAVRECTDYTDRRVSPVEPQAEKRRYGFVTEIHLRENFAKEALKAKE
jgi:hypothetical protein